MCNKVLIPPPESQIEVKEERYASLDGLRAYAAIGIVLMHVLANISMKPSACYLTNELIPFFSDFTLLFMVVSGFSLCCGYYKRIKKGTITPATFYKKRYERILPFFALLCLLDLAISPGMGALYEVFANLTLCFGLLPSHADITVIGVGWFLGVVFLFYMLFPFFVFMLDNRRRAWFSFVLALVFVFVSMAHFDPISRKNMVFCAPLFMAGGIVFLYRERIFAIVRSHCMISGAMIIFFTIAFFAFRHLIPRGFIGYFIELSLFALWLVYAIGAKDAVLNNRMVRYISGISMEVYLSHMVLYRVVEKIHLESFIAQADVLYIITCVLTLGGAICFAHITKYSVIERVMKRISH